MQRITCAQLKTELDELTRKIKNVDPTYSVANIIANMSAISSRLHNREIADEKFRNESRKQHFELLNRLDKLENNSQVITHYTG